MTNDNYGRALADAKAEAAKLTFQKLGIERRLAQLKATIFTLSGLIEDPPEAEEAAPLEVVDLGISEAIRKILKDAGFSMTPAQVKARLSDAAFEIGRYVNASAVIHNTLKRLESQGEVVAVNTPSGTAYAIAPSYGDDLGNLRALQEATARSFEKQLATAKASETAFDEIRRVQEEAGKRAAEAFKATTLARGMFPRKSEGGSK